MKITIAMKFASCLLLAGLSPLVVVSYLNYTNSVQMMTDEIEENLDAYAETKANHINSYFESRKDDMKSLAHNPVIIDAIPGLISSFESHATNPAISVAHHASIRSYLVYHMEAHAYYDMFLISPAGDILFTVRGEDDLGANLRTGSYRDTELGKSFYGAATFLEATMSDFRFYEPSNEPAAFLVAPIYENGILVGLLGAQMDTEVIYKLVQDYTGLGKTGETVIASEIGNSAVIVNPLRHASGAAFNKKVSIGADHEVPIQLAVKGKKGTGIFVDYRGEEVLSAWRYLPHLRLGMVVKQDTSEAYSPIYSLGHRAVGIGVISTIILFGMALALSKTISRPIGQLTQAAEFMAGGDLSVQTKIRTNDEIGDLGRCFNGMVVSTRDLVSDLEHQTSDLERAKSSLAEALGKAEVANQSKSAFLANMSHEIRTPLTAILGFTDILREDMGFDIGREKRTQAIHTISNAGKHLLTIINDILDLSKIEANKMTVEKIETPLIAVLGEVESLMRPHAIAKGLMMSTSLSTPVPEHILCDPTRLRQILLNLSGNAVKFTEEGSVSIIVGATPDQTELTIDIEDTGPGMDDKQAGCLFNAFEQADDTMTRKFGGTGLGLTISRRFANLMGGKVFLLRSHPGVGSCFRLVLPLEAITDSPMVEKFEMVQTGSSIASSTVKLSGRILLAEDGVDNQWLIAFHLKRCGAELTVADNGLIALDLIEQSEADGEPFDMLLTDMQMPEMDGYTLARTLRERGCTLPIVALTAHAMAEDRLKCIEAGCDDYATKPIDKAKLIATCAEWIGKSNSGGRSDAA